EDHTHEISEVNGLQKELDDKVGKTHTHHMDELVDYTIGGTDYLLDWGLYKSRINTTNSKLSHITGKLSSDNIPHTMKENGDMLTSLKSVVNNKSDKNHKHNATEIQYDAHQYSLSVAEQLDRLRASIGDKEHTHEISEINGLVLELFNKADKEHNHDSEYAPTEHNHDSEYAEKKHKHWIRNDDKEESIRVVLDNRPFPLESHTKALIPYIREDVLGDKADVDHTHTASDITDLQATIDTAVAHIAPPEHTHEMSNINSLTTEL